MDEMWGRIYAGTFFDREDADRVWMFRKGQRCRFYTADGQQVGPEHRNVVPAIRWAHAQGWIDSTIPAWLDQGIKREIATGGIR